VKTRIIRIGNSRGIRIPKLLLEQTGLNDEVDVTANRDGLIVRPVRKARAGWAAAFQEMARNSDDALLDDAAPTQTAWDQEEWEWR